MKIIFTPQLIVFIGVAISVAGVMVSAFGAYMASSQQGAFEHDLRIKSEEITKLNKEIVEITQESLRYTLGGDNYPLIFDSLDSSNSRYIFSIGNTISAKPIPLYDIHILLEDIDEKRKIEQDDSLPLKMKMRLMGETTKRFQVDYLSGVGGLRYLCSVTLPPKGEERNYKITMTARNGSVVQYVTIYYDSEYSRYHAKSKAEKDGKELFNSYN